MRPIYDALNDERFKGQIQFHMPGHLRGRGFGDFSPKADMDVTELYETDDLHSPSGVIKRSQEYAANVFGAGNAYYMVNGSTGGVLAMVLGFLKDGDKVIADRCCHKSFISALVLSGAEAVWIYPSGIDGGVMWGSVTERDVEKAAMENPDAKAVYITAPNYFGMMGDVEKIAEAAHRHGMVLLVDGAHGAHYGMNEKLPPSIISLGADAVTLSLHKTLPSLTQSAMLLTKRRFKGVEAALRTVQSSSPSYLLLSACENAVNFYESKNKEGWDALYDSVSRFFPEQLETDCGGVKYKDFSRINLKLGGNPFEAVKRMREEFSIALECAYGEGVIAILTSLHSKTEIEALYRAAKSFEGKKCEPIKFTPTKAKAIHSPREAFFAKKRYVRLEDACGKASAEGIMVYPPGIYQVLPGEEITKESIECVSELLKKGAEIPGLKESYCLIFDE